MNIRQQTYLKSALLRQAKRELDSKRGGYLLLIGCVIGVASLLLLAVLPS